MNDSEELCCGSRYQFMNTESPKSCKIETEMLNVDRLRFSPEIVNHKKKKKEKKKEEEEEEEKFIPCHPRPSSTLIYSNRKIFSHLRGRHIPK